MFDMAEAFSYEALLQQNIVLLDVQHYGKNSYRHHEEVPQLFGEDFLRTQMCTVTNTAHKKWNFFFQV